MSPTSVIRIRAVGVDFEDGTAYFEGCFEFEEDGLVDENFSSFCAEESDFVFCQLDLFSWSIPSN
jgi:hypothetical protein